MRIGAALSGGGHRASAWGVGVLAALVDAGLGRDVVSVSSVSGGSITNGVVAKNVDLRTADSGDFDDAVAGALRNFAIDGLFPNGPLTRSYLRLVKIFAGLSVVLLVAVLIGLVVAAFIDGWAAVGVAAALLVALVVSIIVLVILFLRRGTVVRNALDRTHFDGMPLSNVDRPVNHVVLATDLEAGDQFYLAPRFLYGYREGVADPGPAGTTVAEAVQASAALPGAFPPVCVDTGRFERPWWVPGDEPAVPPDRVWLSDGGVYDNMAEQWESGIEGRLERWRRLGEDHPSSSLGGLALVQEPAEVLIVANASAGWTWRPFGSPRGLIREIVGLLRDQGVQYDVSTTRRRRALFQTWTRNEEVGDWPVGVIVMIDRSPHRMAAAFVHGDDDRAVRAHEAIEYLGHRRYWDDLAERNASVATTLDALGVDTTVDLIEQSYVATLVGLYVLHGIGSLIPFDRHRFESLCGERASLGAKGPEIRSTEPRSP